MVYAKKWRICDGFCIQNSIPRLSHAFSNWHTLLARVEPKVKAFAWTAMHMKIMTTDNLAVRESSTTHYAPYVATTLKIMTTF
jgi:hypothetical protein